MKRFHVGQFERHFVNFCRGFIWRVYQVKRQADDRDYADGAQEADHRALRATNHFVGRSFVSAAWIVVF